MKNNKNILYLPMALMMLLMLSLSSCGNLFDDYPEYSEAETGTLILSLASETTGTRAGDLFMGDALVTKMRIIVFDGGAVEYNHLFVSSDAAFNNPITVVLPTGTKSVYVVANEDNTLLTGLNAITSDTQLEQMMAQSINGSLTPPLLMVGKELNLNLVAGVNNNTITLTRAAARINIRLNKGTGVPVTVSEIRILNNTTETPMWEGGATVTNQTRWHHTESYGAPGQGLTTGDWDALTLYVYENLGNSASSLSNAPLLEIEGTYNELPVTYRAYINHNINATNPAPGDPHDAVVTSNDHYYNIKRNHMYNITGTITGMGEFDGITIYTEVDKNWVPVYKNSFVGYGYTVDVDGKNVTVSNHDEDCPPHEVKLVALQGLTFTDDPAGDTRVFNQTGANDSATFNLSGEPTSGDYLEVYYNGVLVNTFTK